MRRDLNRVAGTVAVAAGLLLALAAPAGAHGGKGVTVVGPGDSIQAAVDAAPAYGTIIVRRGTYTENVAITTDGLKLVGKHARVVAPANPQPNACSGEDPATEGICAIGDVEFPDDGPPVVNDPITDVKISGFRVEGFPGSGIFFLGAENPVAAWNDTRDNEEYGIARFVSSGGRLVGNHASGSEEAGLYVGDSPEANVLLIDNEAEDNELFGFFLRAAAHGTLVANSSHGNCVGAVVLGEGPDSAFDWRFFANHVSSNDRFCPADEEEDTPALSGVGILIASASDNTIKGNAIVRNRPGGPADITGGVVVLDVGGAAPNGNVVTRNLITGNEPDVFWDGSGEGNVFRRNLCRTSVPDGLC